MSDPTLGLEKNAFVIAVFDYLGDDASDKTQIEQFAEDIVLVTDPRQGVAAYTLFFKERKYRQKESTGTVTAFSQGVAWSITHTHIAILRANGLGSLLEGAPNFASGWSTVYVGELRQPQESPA